MHVKLIWQHSNNCKTSAVGIWAFTTLSFPFLSRFGKFRDKTVGEMYISSCHKVLLLRIYIRKQLWMHIKMDVSPGVIFNRHN